MTTVEVFINTDVNRFLLIFNTVEVKMKDGLTLSSSIFINKCKRGTADVFRDSENGTQFFNECGFTGAHAAEEGNDSVFTEQDE